jgi:acyl-CoA thioester hydrolase
MASEFVERHRVEFADTDMAGIMHFAGFFRFMEATEHAFFRSLGLSIHMTVGEQSIGWPRVRAECEYLQPLRFEDEVEVRLRVREKKSKSLTYDFVFRRPGEAAEAVVARGSLTVVCVALDPETRRMRAVPIPELIAGRIEAAPTEVS